MKKILIWLLVFCILVATGCNGSKKTGSKDSSSNSKTNVKLEMSAEQKDIVRINNYATTPAERVSSDKYRLVTFDEYWDYSHHPTIAMFKGEIVVAYASGHNGENNVGQRVMVSKSNGFNNWTTPKAVVDTRKGYYNNIHSYPIGLYDNGEELVLYYGSGEYTPDCLTKEGERPTSGAKTLWSGIFYKTSKDGINWSEEFKVNITGSFIASPMKTKTGRLIMPSAESFAYTDDAKGLTGWKRNQVDPTLVKEAQQEGNVDLSESSFYVLDDNTIFLLCRTGTQYLYAAKSTDNGMTWSKPFATSFSDNGSRFAFNRLNDGRYIYVGTPNTKGFRSPLMLCLSENGFDFDKQFILGDAEYYMIKKPGFAKDGVYGYPAMCFDDEYLYVAYSLGKEAFEVARVKLSDLK